MSAHPLMDAMEALGGDRLAVVLSSADQGPLLLHVSPWCAAPGCLASPVDVAPQLVVAIQQGRIPVPLEIPGRCALHQGEPRALPEPAI